MQTLKDHFNYQARQTYLDLLILWWLLFLLVAHHRRLQKDLAPTHKVAPPFRLG